MSLLNYTTKIPVEKTQQQKKEEINQDIDSLYHGDIIIKKRKGKITTWQISISKQ